MHKIGDIEVCELYLGMLGEEVKQLKMDFHGIIEDLKHYT